MNIRRIAELVGTSHMTVSRALNDSPLVAEKTRRRILETAAQHGYRINAGARGLATGLTTTVGILYPYHRLRAIESWYTSQLMHDIRSQLWEHRFDSMIAGYDTIGDDLADITRLVAQRKVDGLIIIGFEITSAALEALAATTDRYLAVNPPAEPWMESHPAVFVDQRMGGALAAQALRRTGCSRVAAVVESQPQFDTRVGGFRAEWNGEVDLFHLQDGTFESACRTAEERRDALIRYDGLFVGSDVSALGVMKGLMDHGVRIPDDIAVVGYDDIEWARLARPSLTTVHQPRGEVAAAAAAGIVSAIRGEREIATSRTFLPRIERRESCL